MIRSIDCDSGFFIEPCYINFSAVKPCQLKENVQLVNYLIIQYLFFFLVFCINYQVITESLRAWLYLEIRDINMCTNMFLVSICSCAHAMTWTTTSMKYSKSLNLDVREQSFILSCSADQCMYGTDRKLF